MWGFLVGALCLYGLARTMRGGGWAYAHGHGGPWGRRRWGGWNGSGHAGGRGPLRWLFERMDTSPGQEKVIAEAAEALRGTMRGWHDDAERMRSDVARSIRGEAFDAAALEEAFARAEARMAGVRETLRGQAARVHEALDSRQRAELADLLASGRRRRW
ncbi:MAG TPA: periplasmic heavy metal sensor [Myxococcaceae bacterium]